MELDIYLGFSGEMAENMTYDVGYISVIYPGNDALVTSKKLMLDLTFMA